MKVFKCPCVVGYSKVNYFNFFQSKFSSNLHDFDNITIETLTNHKDIEIINDNYFDWISPSKITNSIISITKQNKLNVSENLDTLMNFYLNNICKHIVLRFYGTFTISNIKRSLRDLNKYNIHSVLIVLDFEKSYFTDAFGELIMNLPFNKKLIVFNSPFEKNFEDTMYFTKKTKICGYNKSINEFRVNITLHSESQAHHTYFNRKLYIGPNGEIKNAPECEDSFGFIQDLDNPDQLKSIIQTPEFQKYWFVHKEISDVCKDCEFRHMCVDNRLPYQRKENEWYHKIECNYNPYIAKWEGEEGYKNLAECGVISNENGFTIDHDKIAEINAKLWGEE